MNHQSQPIDKKNTLSWDDIGDIKLGRPNIGNMTDVACYRLLAFSFKEVLSDKLGKTACREVFLEAGHLAGMLFCQNILDCSLPWDDFIAHLGQKMIDYKIGVLRVEALDRDALNFTITVSEDLDCSGLPEYGETVCDYDEGFIAGILQNYSGKRFDVKEIDCWATGKHTCRFDIKLKSG